MRQKQQLIILYRQFAALLSQGISFPEAIAIIGKESDGSRIYDKISHLNEDLHRGMELSEGLARCPEIFPALLIESVETGVLDSSLSQLFLVLAKDKEQSCTFRKRLKRSLSYPCCIIFIALSMMSLMLVFVIPVFTEIFEGFGANLPLPTQILISLASTFHGYGLLAILFILAFVLLLLFNGNSVLSWSTWVPGLRNLTKIIFLFRISVFLEVVSGFDLPDKTILRLATKPLFPSSWKERMCKAIEEADTLETGAAIMSNAAIFPSFYLQMVRVGERSTTLTETFAALAEYYEEEFQRLERRLVIIFDIVAIYVAAVFVALFVFAMYLPLFKLADMA